MNSDKKSVSNIFGHAGFATEQEVACVQIKVEAQDLKEVIEPQIHDSIEKENFKEEFADPEIQNEKVESNEINNQNPENCNEDKPLQKKKVKKQKKKSKKVLQPFDLLEPPSHLLDSYYDLDLSEEFLSQVLKYVDDLCNFINNGDQNLERSMEVNENLNYAVSCYRAKLSQNKQSVDKEAQNQEDFKHEIIDPPDDMPLPDFSADDEEEYRPKKKKIKKSGDGLKRKIKRESRENGDFIGRDGKKKVGRPKKERPEEEIEEGKLFPFIKFNENNKFLCTFCNQDYLSRTHCFLHMNQNHQDEIKAKLALNLASDQVQKYDCEKRNCKKLYGYKRRQFWCEMCTMISKMPKIYDNKPKIKKEPELCPDCGKYVTNLKYHHQTTHTEGSETCPHCNLTGIKYLKAHIQSVHEKTPCEQCGKLIGLKLMYRHVQTQHTHNDNKKYKCEVCGKGFYHKAAYLDHKNVHTGEKPYKCKFCSACFASKGTHAMHQKGHLGHRRNYSKK